MFSLNTGHFYMVCRASLACCEQFWREFISCVEIVVTKLQLNRTKITVPRLLPHRSRRKRGASDETFTASLDDDDADAGDRVGAG
jgi:hypothetical protein